MSELTLKQLVEENLANAAENDYKFEGWTNRAIAMDMIDCGGLAYPGFENTTVSELEAVIKEVRGG